MARCTWVSDNQLYIDYHDNEWGIPVHEDNKLFELLTLESFQSGLSWITILKKRESFRKAFDNFDPLLVSKYDDKKVEELLSNENIIRHKGKITSAINNADKFLEIQKKYGSFNKFIWSYVNNNPLINNYEDNQRPSKTELSDKISKDLKKLGFKFLGSTTIYSFMQASGIVNDHEEKCFKRLV